MNVEIELGKCLANIYNGEGHKSPNFQRKVFRENEKWYIWQFAMECHDFHNVIQKSA